MEIAFNFYLFLCTPAGFLVLACTLAFISFKSVNIFKITLGTQSAKL